jgi:hypothetical protein
MKFGLDQVAECRTLNEGVFLTNLIHTFDLVFSIFQRVGFLFFAFADGLLLCG